MPHPPRVPDQGCAPEEEQDPGRQAIAEYRKWRMEIFGTEEKPEIPDMETLLASMREEPERK